MLKVESRKQKNFAVLIETLGATLRYKKSKIELNVKSDKITTKM